MDELTRKCPKCKKIITYSNKYNLKRAEDESKSCKSCSQLGRVQSKSTRSKISETRIRRGVASGENNPLYGVRRYGEDNPFFGKTHTPETIDRITRKNSEWFGSLDNEKYLEITRKMSDGQKRAMERDPEYYSKIKSDAGKKSILAYDQNKMNTVELCVYETLIDIGFNPKWSFIRDGFQYDFIIEEHKILIEVDGDYWHGNPLMFNMDGSNGKRKLNEVQIDKQNRDVEKNTWAAENGYSLIRIWESDVLKSNLKNKLHEKIQTML